MPVDLGAVKVGQPGQVKSPLPAEPADRFPIIAAQGRSADEDHGQVPVPDHGQMGSRILDAPPFEHGQGHEESLQAAAGRQACPQRHHDHPVRRQMPPHLAQPFNGQKGIDTRSGSAAAAGNDRRDLDQAESFVVRRLKKRPHGRAVVVQSLLE
jgi:hypothetical protein